MSAQKVVLSSDSESAADLHTAISELAQEVDPRWTRNLQNPGFLGRRGCFSASESCKTGACVHELQACMLRRIGKAVKMWRKFAERLAAVRGDRFEPQVSGH